MSVSETARPAQRDAVPLVRCAVPADHAAIRDVVIAAYEQYAEQLPPHVWSDYLSDVLDLEKHASHGRLIVVEVDGRIRGFGAFYPDASVQGSRTSRPTTRSHVRCTSRQLSYLIPTED